MLNKRVSKGKINKKVQLTLTDKDFIIKYDELIMSRELKKPDLDVRGLNLELSKEKRLKIIELVVRKSIRSELANIASEQFQDVSPTPMPFNSTSQYEMITLARANNGSLIATTFVDGIVIPRWPILGPRLPVPIPRTIGNPLPIMFPLELYKKGSLLHWVTGINSDKFNVNVTISEKMKKNTGQKESLTLNDKDFTIKYERLILNKELTDVDLNTDSVDITLSASNASKIVISAVKQVIGSELGLYFDDFLINPLNPEGPYASVKIGSLHHWTSTINSEFSVNITNL